MADAGHTARLPRRSPAARLAMSLPAALVSFLFSAAPAHADLKLCNRMSYVIEAAIGIDDNPVFIPIQGKMLQSIIRQNKLNAWELLKQ